MQIIKQPDGLWSVFNGITDTFCVVNATKDELIAYFGSLARSEAELAARHKIDELESGGKPYHQFTMTWREAVAQHMNYKDNAGDFHTVVEDTIKRCHYAKVH